MLAHFHGEFEAVAPVFRSAEGTAAILPHRLLVEVAPGEEGRAVKELLRGDVGTVDAVRSKWLGGLVALQLRHEPGGFEARTLRDRWSAKPGTAVRQLLYEQIPMRRPLAHLPDDALYGSQWNLGRVEAPNAWDVTRGAGVTIAVFDSGCELTHPDLRFAGSGINVDDPRLDGSPVRDVAGRRNRHGTQTAGVAAAAIDNAIGVAGLAGQAQLLPIASAAYSDAAVAMGIRFAVAHGARVINMSFVTAYLTFRSGPIPAAIEDAYRAGCVLCAAAGNADIRGIPAPARHPRVMCIGGSDQRDERWSGMFGSERRGSNYGDEVEGGVAIGVSVVAPAELVPSTDLVGADATAPVGSPLHGYTLNFWMTSAATPHVSAAAALLFAAHPTLTADQVRRAIEQGAARVGSSPYAYVDGYGSGPRNEYMGYGRLDAFAALRQADLYIRDWPGDVGDEPSAPPDGDFFSHSDVLLRATDDDTFDPASIDAGQLVAGQQNFVYVQVSNGGPSIAHAIDVDVRVAPFVGLEFHYPDDWVLEDALHVRPTRLTPPMVLDAGDRGVAKFVIEAADVDRAAGWEDVRWHPCVLAVVTALADRAFVPDLIDARDVVRRYGNLAQRNLTVVRSAMESIEWLPFAIGHPRNDDDEIELTVDADPRLRGRLRLWLAGAPVALPAAAAADGGQSSSDGDDDAALVFLDRTRLRTTVGGCRGVLTVEPGSRFECGDTRYPTVRDVSGGVVGGGDDARSWVDLSAATARLRLGRARGRRQWLVLEAHMPADGAGQALRIELRQLRRGRALGGASVVYELRDQE